MNIKSMLDLRHDDKRLLQQSLEEEKHANKKLSALAEGRINEVAMSDGGTD